MPDLQNVHLDVIVGGNNEFYDDQPERREGNLCGRLVAYMPCLSDEALEDFCERVAFYTMRLGKGVGAAYLSALPIAIATAADASPKTLAAIMCFETVIQSHFRLEPVVMSVAMFAAYAGSVMSPEVLKKTGVKLAEDPDIIDITRQMFSVGAPFSGIAALVTTVAVDILRVCQFENIL